MYIMSFAFAFFSTNKHFATLIFAILSFNNKKYMEQKNAKETIEVNQRVLDEKKNC